MTTLTISLLVALIVPIAFAVMNVRTDRYFFSPCVTAACALILLISGIFADKLPALLPLLVSFALSIVGDYFMAHQGDKGQFYLFGIGGFLLAHLALIVFLFPRMQTPVWLPFVGGTFAIGYGIYLATRAWPGIDDSVMRVALCAYASTLVLAFILSLGLSAPLLPHILISLGVLSILVSDTMIAECDFADSHRFHAYIMPTYFGCHLLLTAGALLLV